MRTFDAAVLDAFAAGHVAERALIQVDLPSDIYGFWTGSGPFVHGGLTYIGGGSAIDVDGIAGVSDLSSVPVTVRLRSVPDTELTPDVLGTIEQEQYHQRPIVVSRAYFHAETRALLGVEREYRGRIDQIRHVDQVGGETALEVICESAARDHTKTLSRMRSDAEQRRIDPNDRSLRHAALAPTLDLSWGRIEGKPATQGDKEANLRAALAARR